MKIIKNRARCKKCGDIIESRYTHEMVWCSCKSIAVDGGHSYLRQTAEDFDLFEDLSICLFDMANSEDKKHIESKKGE